MDLRKKIDCNTMMGFSQCVCDSATFLLQKYMLLLD